MKSVPFDYHVPSSVAHAVELLRTLPNARVLAGGQSLIPMMNLRAAAPSHLVDLGKIPDLCSIHETASNLRIGAMTTQRSLERSAIIRTHCPLLGEAVDHVGHQQTRNRGTVGGSLCHLDPGAELPVAAAALEVTLTVAGPNGSRTIAFDEFPAGYLTTTLEPDEILTHIDVRKALPREGYAFLEFNQRPADFAVVSVAVLLALDGEQVSQVRVILGGVDYAPIRLLEAEAALAGKRLDEKALDSAAAIAAAHPCEGDEVNPPEFRQHLAGVYVRRALRKAIERTKVSVNA
jgi:aerobic carbon-monoxide dehydrogenase medium subunit